MGDFSRDHMEQKISGVNNFDDLRKLRDEFHEGIHKRVLSFTITDQVEMINDTHDMFIQRTILLAEQMMAEKGLGHPPVSYDFVLFGSGGRAEQTLWSDQDNGIIYDHASDENQEQVETYFNELSGTIVTGLEKIGYPPCDGDVVCSELRWRKPIHHWVDTLHEWFEEPHWEHVRYLLITIDLRAVYGEGILTQQYRDAFAAMVETQPSILTNMLQNTLRHKIILGIFGHLIKEQYGTKSGGIDIKYGAYIPMVNGIRLLAIQAGIYKTSTIDRIRSLQEYKIITSALADEWLKAFTNFLKLRTMTFYKLEDGHYSSNGILKANELTKSLVPELKKSLRVGKDMQRYIERSIEMK